MQTVGAQTALSRANTPDTLRCWFPRADMDVCGWHEAGLQCWYKQGLSGRSPPKLSQALYHLWSQLVEFGHTRELHGCDDLVFQYCEMLAQACSP